MQPHNSMEELFNQYSQRELLDFYQRLQSFKNKLSLLPNSDAVRTAFDAVDKAMQVIPDDIKKNIPCKKGCAFCCHIKVVTSELETDLIVSHCNDKGIEIDTETLQKQKDLGVEEYLFSPHKRCVFLDTDNTCKIYEVRPVACRSHTVTSEAALCDTDKYPHGFVAEYFNMDAAIPTVALLDISCVGSFPGLLLKSIHKTKT
jgi:Fe-S-cluster containining protein